MAQVLVGYVDVCSAVFAGEELQTWRMREFLKFYLRNKIAILELRQDIYSPDIINNHYNNHFFVKNPNLSPSCLTKPGTCL